MYLVGRRRTFRSAAIGWLNDNVVVSIDTSYITEYPISKTDAYRRGAWTNINLLWRMNENFTAYKPEACDETTA
jgi:hypothetical protein